MNTIPSKIPDSGSLAQVTHFLGMHPVITDKAHAGIYAIFIEEVQNSPFSIEIVESK